jgi:autotransporter adhesin
MVDPISNVNTSCKSCHPSDAVAKAQTYAVKLNKQVGLGGGSGSAQISSTPGPAASPTAPSTRPVAATAAPLAAVPAADMVDYSQRYDVVALGKQPLNIGNTILIALLAILVLGFGFLVLKREGWINVTFDNPKRVAVPGKYPSDVVELLSSLNQLKPASRQNLKNILAKPQAAGDLFASIDKLTQSGETGPEAPADSESPKT